MSTDLPSTRQRSPGATVTLQDARDLDRLRPDDVATALKLDWGHGMTRLALLTVVYALVLTPLGIFLDNGGLAGAVYVGLPVALHALWAPAPDWFGISRDRHAGTLRSVLPLSRRAVVRARYIEMLLGLAAVWVLLAALSALVASVTSMPLLRMLGMITAGFVAMVVMELAAFPVLVRKGQGWAIAAWVAAMAVSVAVSGGFVAAGGLEFAQQHPVLTGVGAAAMAAACVYASYRSTLSGYLAADV